MFDWSIIIIGRNESKHIELCIEYVKIACSKLKTYEIIYVDCGSNDNSIELAQKNSLKVISLNPNRPTASLARNAGAQFACGNYICFIDADLIMDKNWLFTAEKYFFLYKEADMICGQLKESKIIFTRIIVPLVYKI